VNSPSAATGPILEVRDLERTFGSVVAARDITIAIPRHEIVGIIGTNGAGKTTFVNMITGYLRPSKGHILFEGGEITGLPSRHIMKLGLSRSFQVPQVFASLSVMENMCVALGLAEGKHGLMARTLRPLRTPQVIARAEETLALFQITDYRDALVGKIPQGIRKLLDIAMATVGQPRLVMLDEPTSGISIEEKFGLMDIIMAALKTRDITVLFVEHDMEIVRRYADRVLAFYEGAVIADGTPDFALKDEKVRALIIGEHHVPGGGAGETGAGT
jgi:branched-chain amino acid transport system ATP-binding protein